MSAASQARRRKSPDELEIIAFERGYCRRHRVAARRRVMSSVIDQHTIALALVVRRTTSASAVKQNSKRVPV
ncbi:hypothetical protein ABT009_46455 [Streptomyces sp. NPDC002896]|uniref:hypothetical protein n=1 Tax=Streptomyces sp. NPDC002896 TaxID=3154438 RepID=UPI0033209D27